MASITPFDNPTVYTIKAPRGMTWRPELAQALMTRLSAGRVALQINAEYSSVKWQIVDTSNEARGDMIRSAVLSVYPDAEVQYGAIEVEDYSEPYYRAVIPYTQAAPFIAPILYPTDLKHYDPLIPLSNMMGDLIPGERFVYTVYVGPPSQTLHQEAQKLLQRGGGEMAALYAVDMALAGLAAATKSGGGGLGKIEKDRYVPELQRLFEEKVNDILFPCYIFFQVDSQYYDRLYNFSIAFGSTMYELSSQLQALIEFDDESVAKELVAEIDSVQKARNSNNFRRLEQLYLAQNRGSETRFTQTRQQIRCVLNVRELASLWHLPHEEYTAPAIERVNARNVRIPSVLRGSQSGVSLGINSFGGMTTRVHMLESDRHEHMLVVGKTGMGKSTFLHQLIRHDIAQGRGVAVLDPEGRLIQDILRYSIPSEREEEVVVWDLANTDYPPPLNPLAVADEINRHDTAAELMDIFERLEPRFATTRMAGTLSDVLETLMGIPDATFRDMRKLFMDDEYRDEFIESIEDDAAYEFWADYDEMPQGQRRDLITPVLHRLRRFYRGPVLQPIMCHPQALDINSLISQNKIILVSLQAASGARVAEWQQDLLGSIIVSQFEAAASMDAARQPFFLYVDEADRFVSSSVDTLFKRARKRNVHLTLATQYLSQLTGTTLDAIIGNTGAVVAFKCGDPDARALFPYMKPSFSSDDLLQFSRFQAAVYMKYDGQQLPAFNIETGDIPQNEDEQADRLEREQAIRQASIERYTPMRRDEITKGLKERYPRQKRRKPGEDEPSEDDYRDYVDDEE